MKRYIRAASTKVIEYRIKDLDAIIIVELTTKREILSWLNEFLENNQYDWYETDDAWSILYDDGSSAYISQLNYEGESIRKTHIDSIVYSNDSTYMVAGNYAINEYGVVQPSYEMHIDDNIERVK